MRLLDMNSEPECMLSPSESVDVFIRRALPRAPDTDDDEMVKSLLADSIDGETAECLVAFVPMAFAHVILGAVGVRVPDSFLVNDASAGRYAHGKLRDEPIFVAAHARALSMLSGGLDAQKSAREIASLSAEWNAIAELTSDGSDPAGCVLTETILMRLPPDHLAKRKPLRRHWWKFWDRSS
jgi:hypothetical protein